MDKGEALDMSELRGNSDSGWAIWGGSNSGTGIVGTAGSGVGTYGESTSGYGVFGRSNTATGVVGDTLASNSPGVWGHARGSGNGVLGSGSDGNGVSGVSGSGNGVSGSSNVGAGVFGITTTTNGVGVHGIGRRAGVFEGIVTVLGDFAVSNGTKNFKIDHPLEPQGKYLLHTCVESSEMKNVYDGIAELGADGAALVFLPEWFEALNGEFRYQLTPIGGAGPNLHVAEEVSENRFKIAGGKAGMRVCWQVTGSRKDPWAKANPFDVEQEKSQDERGRYLEPNLYNAPEEQRVMITGSQEADKLRQRARQELPQDLPQAPGMPLGFAAPGFGSQE
jgi:hypothetical protein